MRNAQMAGPNARVNLRAANRSALSAAGYDARRARVSKDLQRTGPIEPVLAFIDPVLAHPIQLTRSEFEDLVRFVRDALLDDRAGPRQLCALIPDALPSRRPLLLFEGCEGRR